MALYYFGARSYPESSTNNGNWQDINQWYTDPGDGNYYYPAPSTRATTFPTAADTVEFVQEVLSNVGTYTGTYPSGSWSTNNTFSGNTRFLLARGVGIWTGKASGDITIYGNSGNTLPWLNGTFDRVVDNVWSNYYGSYLTMTGGLCSSPLGDGVGIKFKYGTVTSSFDSRVTAITIQGKDGSFYNPIKVAYLRIEQPFNFANGIQQMDRFYSLANTIIPFDISTHITGCYYYYIGNGTFTNTNPWIIGTSNIKSSFAFTDSGIPANVISIISRDVMFANVSQAYFNRPRTIITGNITSLNTSSSITLSGANSTYSGIITIANTDIINLEGVNSTFNGNITIYASNTLSGLTLGGSNAKFNTLINVITVPNGPTVAQTSALIACLGGSYNPPAGTFYINTSQQGSNTIIQSKDFSLIDLGFAKKGTFNANVVLLNIPTAADILSTHLI